METVKWFGSLGALDEQLFEHFKRKSLENRETHSNNRCTGIRIAEDIVYSWLRSSPKALHELSNIEDERVKQEILKRR